MLLAAVRRARAEAMHRLAAQADNKQINTTSTNESTSVVKRQRTPRRAAPGGGCGVRVGRAGELGATGVACVCVTARGFGFGEAAGDAPTMPMAYRRRVAASILLNYNKQQR